jgi:subtilisin family serine protease
MSNRIVLTLLAALLVACNSLNQASSDLVNLGGNPAVAGQVLVKYGNRVSLASLQPLGKSKLLSSLSDSSFGTLALVAVPRGQEMAFVQNYSRQAGVEYAEPNYWISRERSQLQLNLAGGVRGQALSGQVTDQYFVEVPPTDPFKFDGCLGLTNPQPGANCFQYQNVPYLWGLFRIKAPEVWSSGITGKDVVVAVIDEGADLTHPDLKDNLWTNPNPSNPSCPGLHGYDFIDQDADPSDTGGHGTHTAGTVAAAANGTGVVGVAPEAKLLIVRALGYQGGSTYALTQALKYVADCGAKVSNNSWGGGSKSKAFEDALGYGIAKGHTYVFSAGNSHREGSPRSDPVGNATTLKGVIGVGAISPNNIRTGFSNIGDYVTVGAPGQAIMSTIPQEQGGYAFLQGTSMAGPHVAGVVALMLQAKPGLKPEQIREALEQSANPTLTGQISKPDYADPNPGWYGFGMVDAKGAVEYVKGKF